MQATNAKKPCKVASKATKPNPSPSKDPQSKIYYVTYAHQILIAK